MISVETIFIKILSIKAFGSFLKSYSILFKTILKSLLSKDFSKHSTTTNSLSLGEIHYSTNLITTPFTN